MTKEELIARVATLEKERDMVKSQYIAYEGAIQEANFWLKSLDKHTEDTNG